jgi:hypothetical protein
LYPGTFIEFSFPDDCYLDQLPATVKVTDEARTILQRASVIDVPSVPPQGMPAKPIAMSSGGN